MHLLVVRFQNGMSNVKLCVAQTKKSQYTPDSPNFTRQLFHIIVFVMIQNHCLPLPLCIAASHMAVGMCLFEVSENSLTQQSALQD